jgi:hypothetical protein
MPAKKRSTRAVARDPRRSRDVRAPSIAATLAAEKIYVEATVPQSADEVANGKRWITSKVIQVDDKNFAT